MQIVGWGLGRYFGEPPSTPNSTTTWNLENPLRRDTFTVPAQSHVVVRFRADNPGMWILHCHVAWHLEGKKALPAAEYCAFSLVRDSSTLAMLDFSRYSAPSSLLTESWDGATAGMAASFLERPDALRALVGNMDPELRTTAQGFCAGRNSTGDGG